MAQTQGKSQTTCDHETIRQWAEERNARPSRVKGTGDGDSGLLRLNFPGYSGEDRLEEISWDAFFETFDQSDLCLVYQETTAGGEKSNFHKIISRETAERA